MCGPRQLLFFRVAQKRQKFGHPWTSPLQTRKTVDMTVPPANGINSQLSDDNLDQVSLQWLGCACSGCPYSHANGNPGVWGGPG